MARDKIQVVTFTSGPFHGLTISAQDIGEHFMGAEENRDPIENNGYGTITIENMAQDDYDNQDEWQG